VAAVIFNPTIRKLTMVNQFRYPTYKKGPGWITELVAGMVDHDEDPEFAMRREIAEETGYSVTKVEFISTFYLSPGGSSERISLYYAEVAERDKVGAGGGLATENEDIITVELSLAEALAGVRSGTIADAKTILGIFWLQMRMAQRAAPTDLRQGV
jgi:ADP-ribose pyrophosphatase